MSVVYEDQSVITQMSKFRLNITQSNIITNAFVKHIMFYPTPSNVTYAWSFGSLAGIFFVIQILTGIFLAMHYISEANFAFNSIWHIMGEVHNGWLVRYMHSNGASMVFILIYLHIGRGLYFQSYRHRRETLWFTGLIIFILMMATAFIGYVLPWGQMSFWGATVITSLVTAIPFIGDNIATWLWGGFSVSHATLTRFYSLHYLLPFIITGLILVHLVVLHEVTSTNPEQIPSDDKLPFMKYFFYKDLFCLNICLLFYVFLVFFAPNWLGHPDNWIRANALSTPAHIVPEWYFTPFYAILRSCPSKLGGVISMGGALLVLFILPFYRTDVTSISSNKSPYYRIFFWLFVSVFFSLMFVGGKPATYPYVQVSQLLTVLYFSYFLLIIPARLYFEKFLRSYSDFQ